MAKFLEFLDFITGEVNETLYFAAFPPIAIRKLAASADGV